MAWSAARNTHDSDDDDSNDNDNGDREGAHAEDGAPGHGDAHGDAHGDGRQHELEPIHSGPLASLNACGGIAGDTDGSGDPMLGITGSFDTRLLHISRNGLPAENASAAETIPPPPPMTPLSASSPALPLDMLLDPPRPINGSLLRRYLGLGASYRRDASAPPQRRDAASDPYHARHGQDGYATTDRPIAPPASPTPTPTQAYTQPAGALSRRFATISAPRIPVPPPPTPLSVGRLVTDTLFVASEEGYPPGHMLIMLHQQHRRLWIHPALLPRDERRRLTGRQGYAETEWQRTRMATAIDSHPILRYLVAALWVRWRYAPQVIAAALDLPTPRDPREFPAHAPWSFQQPLCVAFAPFTGASYNTVEWRPWHLRYYTTLWRMTNRLVAAHEALDAYTAHYLRFPSAEQVPPLGVQRERAVLENALTVRPALRHGATSPDEVQVLAWEHYTRQMAHALCVPALVARDRVAGDMARVRSATDLSWLTDELIADDVSLSYWRQDVARCFHLRSGADRRTGVYRTASQAVALWIGEPVNSIPALPSAE